VSTRKLPARVRAQEPAILERDIGGFALLEREIAGFSVELVQAYLASTGLSAMQAAAGSRWTQGVGAVLEEVLSHEEQERMERQLREWRLHYHYAICYGAGIEEDDMPVKFRGPIPEERLGQIRAVVDALESVAIRPDATIDEEATEFKEALCAIPFLRVIDGEIVMYETIAADRTTQMRAAKLAEHLTVDGVLLPDLYAWVTAQGQMERVTKAALDLALERLAREEAERLVVEERDRVKEVTQQRDELASELVGKRRQPVQLGDRIVFPRALIDAGYQRGAGARSKLEEAQQGSLFADESALAVMREAAEVCIERTQLGNLTPSQVRALAAVFRLFSSTGDDGKEYAQNAITVDARLMYRAGEVDPHNGRACRDMFHALLFHSHRDLYVALKFREADGGYAVAGERCPAFRVTPLWRAHTEGRKRRTEAEADAIANAWIQGGQAIGTEKIPLPDSYEVVLPLLIRKVFKSLVVAGDVLQRLDAGAKATRGKTESFSGLEWRLFIEITQRNQARHASADGQSLKSYVDRDALLADYYGIEETKRARSRGKYNERYVSQYEKAVATLESGEIARRVEAGKAGRRGGTRDVFELTGEIVHGLQARARKALDPAKKRATDSTTAGRRAASQKG
jgi:hypothetical protein